MSEPTACLSLVTLGVSDLAKSTAFYEALGFRRKSRGAAGVAFLEAGGIILSLWPTAELAKDAEIESANSGGFRGSRSPGIAPQPQRSIVHWRGR
jgi:uncharacterized protein